MENKNTFKKNINESRTHDLLDLILLFWENRKSIILITSFFIVFGLIYALLSTPWFQASVKIMPDNSKGGNILGQYSNLAALAGINIGSDGGDNYALYPDIIKSNFILDKILDHKFKVSANSEPVTLFKFWETDPDTSEKNWKDKLYEDAKKELRETYINVSIDKINNLLTIKIITPKSPILAAELANFIAKQLDIYNKHFRHYKATDQRIFIINSLKDAKENLKLAETNLSLFLEKNKSYSSPDKKLHYERLVTEFEVQRNIYIELKKQLELVKISEIKETETINVLEEAIVPVKKIKPRRLIILIVFTILGIIFSIFFVIFQQYYFNTKKIFIEKYKNL